MKAEYIKIKPKTVLNISGIVTIHYYEFGPSFVFQGESHDFWEMVYVDKGRVQIRRDQEKIVLEQGQVVFHKPNEFHSIQALDSAPNLFVVSFSCPSEAMTWFERYQTQLDRTLKSYVTAIIREAEQTYVIPKNDTELKKLIRKENAPLGGEQLIKTYLEQLLLFLLRTITKKEAPVLTPQKEPEKNPLVQAVLGYLGERVEEVVRIEDICVEFGYSRSYLSRVFQAETGQTLAACAMKMKVDRAKQLIRETNMNFAQISARLSFENPQYFSRVFKRLTGMTPSEFKNRAHV